MILTQKVTVRCANDQLTQRIRIVHFCCSDHNRERFICLFNLQLFAESRQVGRWPKNVYTHYTYVGQQQVQVLIVS